MSKPNYRIRYQVYDAETEEVVLTKEQPFWSKIEDMYFDVVQLVKQFKIKQEEFEATYYPKT